MNKIYKVVWSKVKNCYVVVSEIAKNVITGGVKSAKVGKAPLTSGLAMGALMAFVITGSAMAADIYDEYPAYFEQSDQVVDVKVVGGDITTKEDVYVVGPNTSVTMTANNITVTGYAADNTGIMSFYESNDITLNATEKLDVNGAVWAYGADSEIALNGNDIVVKGDVLVAGEQSDVSLTAGETLNVTGAVWAYGADTKVGLTSNDVTVDGNVTTSAKAQIDVAGTTGATVNGSVHSAGYGGTINIDGGEQTTITGSVNITNPNQYGGGNAGGDTINIGGKNISVGDGVMVNGGYYGFGKETAVNLGTADTELVKVEASQIGLWSQYEDSDINVYGKELNIEVSGENTYSGIYTGNNSEAYTPSAEVNIYSDHTKINMVDGGPAIVALSQSTLNIHGGLEVSADEAIVARGNSTINVNAKGEGVVKLDGDIEFNSQGTNKFVAAHNNVNVNMTTADSYLNGKIYVSNSDGSTQTYEDVSGMKLGMSNGATWNVTGDSFVNNLYGTDAKLTGKDVEVVVYNREDESGVAVTNSKLDIAGVDLVIDTEKTAIYNQDITIKSDSDVTIKSQQQGISAYGDVVIEAANVTIESVDNGIQSVADANPNDVGNVTIKATEDVNIKATTEGYAVTNVSKNGGVIDIEGKNVTLVSENRTAVKVGHEVGETGYNGIVNVTGETITIEGAAKEAKEGQYRQSAAVLAQGSETELNLNATDAITIKNTGSTEGSAIGAYEGGKVAVDAGEGTVDINGQVTVAVGSEVTVKGADVTVNSVEDALDTWGGNIEITADNSIEINSSEKDGVQANDATITLDAANVDIQAKKWGINNIAENDSSVIIKGADVVIKGEEGAIRTLNNGIGEVTVNATGTTYIEGAIYAEGQGIVNVGFKGAESALKGAVNTYDDAKTKLSFAEGATWYADGYDQNVVTNLDMQDGNIVLENAQADSITIETLTGTSMNVDVASVASASMYSFRTRATTGGYINIGGFGDGDGDGNADDVHISVSTSGTLTDEQIAGLGNAVQSGGESVVDEITAADSYIKGDIRYEADGKGGFIVAETTLNGDVKVNGDLTADNLYTKDEIDAYRDQVNQNLEDKFAAAQDQVADKFAEVEADYKAADAELQVNIDREAQIRGEADNKLQANIDAEAQARQEADNKLQANIDAEAQARQEADNRLQANIDANVANIANNASNIEANKQAIDAEKAAREEADAALSDAIDNVAGDIAETKAQVEDNKAAIEQNAQDIANETADRVAADNKLQANLDKESVDRQIADAQERAERAQADQELQNAIDAEEQARKDADAAEAKARQEADAELRRDMDSAVSNLNNRIDKVDAKIDKVGAMAAAMASLKTMGYDPEAPTEIAVGIGQYRNETGIAIGAFHYPNKNFMLNFSLSTAGDEVMGGIGATWKIGRKR